MIVKFYELKKNLKENKFFLLYGANKGLIEETVKNNLKPLLSKNVYNYEENEVINDLENFKEKIFNKSLFESEKLIIINRVSEKILSIVKEIMDVKTQDFSLILISGILEKKSKLRNFFEKDKN